uniref:Evasin n=1 Tax=Rhipicephalus zambeziensis TaxID=60191 RepID=A0A224Y3C2_9ACAR
MNVSIFSAICFFCSGLAIVMTIRETTAVEIEMEGHKFNATIGSRGNQTHNDSVAQLAHIFGTNQSNTSLALGDYEYRDLCLYDAVNSTCGVVSIGCNKSCLEEGAGLLPNDTLCVVNVSLARVKNMDDYTNFTCLLGMCDCGSCVNSNIAALCEKFPVTSVSL